MKKNTVPKKIAQWRVYKTWYSGTDESRKIGRQLRRLGFVSIRRRDAGTVYYHPAHWSPPTEVRLKEIKERAARAQHDPCVWISEVILDPISTEAKTEKQKFEWADKPEKGNQNG